MAKLKNAKKRKTVSKKKRIQVSRICFDIETESFSDEFRYAKGSDRLQHAPKMRLACIYDDRTWHFFPESKASDLIKILLTTDEIISFNGKDFDELVLRRHYGLKGSLPKKGNHIDLFAIIRDQENVWVSLDRLAKKNLGEGKHTKGRDMADLDLDSLKEACRSDVSQTYRLWELWRDGKLKIPEQKQSRFERRASYSDFSPFPGQHMPTICPECSISGSLIFMDCDTSDMTEGQESEYLAGTWGFAFCQACETDIHWEM